MNRNERIEDMARVYEEARYRASETLGRMNEGAAKWYAKAFYEADYRKASEVAKEIFAELKTVMIDEWRYPIIAELKKKYTEGENESN